MPHKDSYIIEENKIRGNLTPRKRESLEFSNRISHIIIRQKQALKLKQMNFRHDKANGVENFAHE